DSHGDGLESSKSTCGGKLEIRFSKSETNRRMIPSTHLAGMLRGRGGSGRRAALSNQHQIANVDQRVRKIGEDADRIALKDEIKAHDHAASDAPIPKRDRYYAFALSLRGDP